MEHDTHSIVLSRPQRRESLCVDGQRICGVAGLALHHLELSDVGDVFDRRGLAQASEKAREGLAILELAGRTRRLADDESTGHSTKRFVSH